MPDSHRHERRLNTIHNLYYYQQLMSGLRDTIATGRLAEFSAEFYEKCGQSAAPVYNTPFP